MSTDNGWATADHHPVYKQLVLPSRASVRMTESRKYREVAHHDAAAPEGLEWTSTVIRLADHRVFVAQGPTNDASWRAALALAEADEKAVV